VVADFTDSNQFSEGVGRLIRALLKEKPGT
jgi:hypothetical protein